MEQVIAEAPEDDQLDDGAIKINSDEEYQWAYRACSPLWKIYLIYMIFLS